MDFFFYTPFASSGDKTAVPVAAQPDGSISYAEGYPVDYEQDPSTDPLTAKDVERRKYNQVEYAVTNAIKELQANAIPDFIDASLNGGVAYPYQKLSLVIWYNGVERLVYESLVDGNTALPSDATKWRIYSVSSIPTGAMIQYDGADLPANAGFIWPDGKTIGNASSNATNRANADTLALFTLIWNSYSDALRPIYTSAGALSTRGANAAADYAANKAITVRDKRGRGGVGRDNMGGTAANRVTVAGCGVDGTILGAVGGAQNVQLTDAQNGTHSHGPGSIATTSAGDHTHAAGTLTADSNGAHSHTVPGYTGSSSPIGLAYGGSVLAGNGTTSTAGAHTHTISGATATAGAHTHPLTGTSATSGNGDPHLNMQPFDIENYLLKLTRSYILAEENMTDPTTLAAFMARMDERTLNMAGTMARIEGSLKEHKDTTDKRFAETDKKIDEMMKNHVEPVKEKLNNLYVKVALLAAGSGTGGFLIAKLMGVNL